MDGHYYFEVTKVTGCESFAALPAKPAKNSKYFFLFFVYIRVFRRQKSSNPMPGNLD
jgi:hypothetical protein